MERLYCGTQFKKLICVSSKSFKIIGSINTKGSVNSISLGFSPHTLIIGQTSGYLSVVKINADRLKQESNRQQSASQSAKAAPIEKLKEVRLFDANISKVVRTTRNDLAIGTSKGVYFYTVGQDFSVESVTASN